MAVTVVLADTVVVQLPVPLHPPPLHPVKVEPVPGAAVRVTLVPPGTSSEQSMPQLMPRPGHRARSPSPALLTVRV